MLDTQKPSNIYQSMLNELKKAPPNYTVLSQMLITIMGRKDPEEMASLNQTEKNGDTLYHHILNSHHRSMEKQYVNANGQAHLPIFNEIPDDLRMLLSLLSQLQVELKANKRGETPVHLAVKMGIPALLTMIMEQSQHAGLALDSQNHQGDTALHVVCKGTLGNDSTNWVFHGLEEETLKKFDERYANCCRILLEKMPQGLNLQNTYGETPLHCVIRDSRSPKLLSCLMEQGVDLTVRTCEHDTCLHLAVSSERNAMDLTLALLAPIASNKASASVQALLTANNLEGNHFLHALVKKIISIDEATDEKQRNEKIQAKKAQMALITWVLSSIQINPNITNRHQETMLHVATYGLQLEKCRALLRYGIDVNLQDIAGDTVCQLAVQQYLDIEAGRSHFQDKKALKAAKKNAFEVIKCLMEYNPRTDIPNKAGVRVQDIVEVRELRKLLNLGRHSTTSQFAQPQHLLETLFYERKWLAALLQWRQALPGQTKTRDSLVELGTKFQTFYQQLFDKTAGAEGFLVASTLRELKQLLADIVNQLDDLKKPVLLREQSLITFVNQFVSLTLEKDITESMLKRFNQCLNSAVMLHLRTLLNQGNLAQLKSQWDKNFDEFFNYAQRYHGEYQAGITKLIPWTQYPGYANAIDYYKTLDIPMISDILTQVNQPMTFCERFYSESTWRQLYPQAEQVVQMLNNRYAMDSMMMSLQDYIEKNKGELRNLHTFHEKLRWHVFIAQSPYQRLTRLIQEQILAEDSLLMEHLVPNANQLKQIWYDKSKAHIVAFRQQHEAFIRKLSTILPDADSGIYQFRAMDFDMAMAQTLQDLAWVELFDTVLTGLHEQGQWLFSSTTLKLDAVMNKEETQGNFFQALAAIHAKLSTVRTILETAFSQLIEQDWNQLNKEIDTIEAFLQNVTTLLLALQQQSVLSQEEQIKQLQQKAKELDEQIQTAYDEDLSDEYDRIIAKLQQLQNDIPMTSKSSIPAQHTITQPVVDAQLEFSKPVQEPSPTTPTETKPVRHGTLFSATFEPSQTQPQGKAPIQPVNEQLSDLILLDEVEKALQDSTYSEADSATLQNYINKKRQEVQQGKLLSAKQRQEFEARKQKCLAKAKPVMQGFGAM